MMQWFRHVGCDTPLIAYIGTIRIDDRMHLREQDWLIPHEHTKKIGTPVFYCPDCGSEAVICSSNLRECDPPLAQE